MFVCRHDTDTDYDDDMRHGHTKTRNECVVLLLISLIKMFISDSHYYILLGI